MSDFPHISHLKLSGYKSIKNLECDLKPGLNVIIGKNGSGKTNFLRFLQKLLMLDTGEFQNILAVITHSDQKKEKVIKIQKKLNNEVHEYSLKIGTHDYEFLFEIKEGEEYFKSFSKDVALAKLRSWMLSSRDVFISHGLPKKYEGVSHSLRMSFEKKGVRVTDQFMFEKSIQLTKNSDVNTSYSLFNWIYAELIYGENTELDFKKFPNLKFLSERLPLCSSVEEVKINPNFLIDKESKKEITTVDFVYMSFRIGTDWYRMDELSDGTQRLVYLLLELGEPVSAVNNGEGMVVQEEHIGGMYLIEEPELGIHPHQLHSLMQIIKEESQKKNIIISTHSPEVLNHLTASELDRILISSFDSEKGTQMRNLTDEEVSKAQNYMKDLDISDYWVHSDLED